MFKVLKFGQYANTLCPVLCSCGGVSFYNRKGRPKEILLTFFRFSKEVLSYNQTLKYLV